MARAPTTDFGPKAHRAFGCLGRQGSRKQRISLGPLSKGCDSRAGERVRCVRGSTSNSNRAPVVTIGRGVIVLGTGAAWAIPRVTIVVGAGAVPKIRGLKRP